jgi:4-carboxymuconolactone decarboxylase
MTACSQVDPHRNAGTASSGSAAPVDDLATVSPALAHYRDQVVLNDLWERPDLSPRDRSLVTVSALITGNQAGEMPHYFTKALDDGLTPAELSETITHLAFYAGWPSAFTAATQLKAIAAEQPAPADR